MSDTIKLKQATTLKYQSNLGDEIQDLSFEAGQELAILKVWQDFYLVKDDEGKLLSVKKDLAEEV